MISTVSRFLFSLGDGHTPPPWNSDSSRLGETLERSLDSSPSSNKSTTIDIRSSSSLPSILDYVYVVGRVGKTVYDRGNNRFDATSFFISPTRRDFFSSHEQGEESLSSSLSLWRGTSVDLCRPTCFPFTVDDLSVAVYRLVMASLPFFLDTISFVPVKIRSPRALADYIADIRRTSVMREIRDILRHRNRSLMRVWWGLELTPCHKYWFFRIAGRNLVTRNGGDSLNGWPEARSRVGR